jgi:hypothetical protein
MKFDKIFLFFYLELFINEFFIVLYFLTVIPAKIHIRIDTIKFILGRATVLRG